MFKEYPEMKEFIKKIKFSNKMEDSGLASAVITNKNSIEDYLIHECIYF